MNYHVSLNGTARREILALPRKQQAGIVARIAALGESPRGVNTKKLQGSNGIYRLRVGSYRVLFIIDDARQAVEVCKIAHRRDAYR